MTARRPLVAGNWKMNGLCAARAELDKMIAGAAALPANVDVLVCPPAPLIHGFAARARGSRIAIGGQDCHAEPSGAFTGDISAEMLADAGAALVIVGHSERRAECGETDAIVRAKAMAAHRGGLEPIVCVGESLEERKAGRALAVVTAQIAGSIDEGLAGAPFAVAYEPVWAIGTGLTPTISEIEEVHDAIRRALGGRVGAKAAETPILYGGSVKPANAAEILHAAEVGGALVGGASLKAAEFLQIVRAV